MPLISPIRQSIVRSHATATQGSSFLRAIAAAGFLHCAEQLPVASSQFRTFDTGVGLPAGITDEIFHAFFTTQPQGSGKGLAISRSFVESRGGHWRAKSHDERGATRQLTLPAAPAETNRAMDAAWFGLLPSGVFFGKLWIHTGALRA
jgi:signal transduction histidine kinase